MIYEVLSGGLMMACLTIGFFFLKFWQKTRDSLFMMFSFSFFIMALERLILGYLGNPNVNEVSPLIYLIRLVAFVLILIAIIQKNRENSERD